MIAPPATGILAPAALVLDTPRLRLRPYRPGDLDIARAVLCDPEVTRHVCEPMTPDEVPDLMPDIVRRGAGGRIGMWCAEIRATGEKIGDGVLAPLPVETDETPWQDLVPDRYPEGRIEIGYMLKRSAWGRGYATEICARLLRFAFEATALDEVVAVTDPANSASQAVLAKCAMRDCGTGFAYAATVRWFEITKAEWLAAQASQK